MKEFGSVFDVPVTILKKDLKKWFQKVDCQSMSLMLQWQVVKQRQS